MGQDCVAQHRVGQVTEHRSLHRYHQLARFELERGEAQNLVAVFGDEYPFSTLAIQFGSLA
jgi:hypothetical protein